MAKSKVPNPGRALRAWREKSGKTQTECADAVGVTQSAWAEWESGARCPREPSAEAIERLTSREVRASDFARRRHASGEAA